MRRVGRRVKVERRSAEAGGSERGAGKQKGDDKMQDTTIIVAFHVMDREPGI